VTALGRYQPVEAGNDFSAYQPANLTRAAEFGQNQPLDVSDDLHFSSPFERSVIVTLQP
jgi:hypothetical protein